MPKITDFDHYYKYNELVSTLKELAESNHGLCKLESVGKSYEGREIWAMEITNYSTGAALEKPGYYMDGNFHASEVAGSMACLYTIQYLLANYGEDKQVTEILDNYTFYILPRISPDGAEYFLTTPHTVRSSMKLYPHEEEKDGLHPEDINGDGFILQMRVKDPNGGWKISPEDNRLMVRRMPDETDGIFYKIYTEGTIRNYDGHIVKTAPSPRALDFNRNFPANWGLEHIQHGAGSFPLSESETRTVAEFVISHSNITGIQSLHTGIEVILRPYTTKPDDTFPKGDLELYKTIGRRGTEITGFPVESTYKWSKLHGQFIEWAYEHQGLIAYVTEIWSLAGQAGIDLEDIIKAREDKIEQERHELAILRWNDEKLNGEAFVNWTPYEHPQLGTVEIGGWKHLLRADPPINMLNEICHKVMLFALAHASAAPRVRIVESNVVSLGNNLFKVGITVENQGYLATNITQQAQNINIAQPVAANLRLKDGIELIMGKEKVELGNLAGRGGRSRAEWLVRTQSNSGESTSVEVVVVSQKGGRDCKEITLMG